MKKGFVLVLLALILGVGLAVQLSRDPGYILVSYGNYTFETSLFALVIALLIIYVVLKLVFSLLRWLNPLRWFRDDAEDR